MTRPRDLTEREKLLEALRICEGQVNEQRAWCDANRIDNMINEHAEEIQRITEQMNAILESHRQAPARLAKAMKALKVAKYRVTAYENRHIVARLRKQEKKAKELKAQLDQ